MDDEGIDPGYSTSGTSVNSDSLSPSDAEAVTNSRNAQDSKNTVSICEFKFTFGYICKHQHLVLAILAILHVIIFYMCTMVEQYVSVSYL